MKKVTWREGVLESVTSSLDGQATLVFVVDDDVRYGAVVDDATGLKIGERYRATLIIEDLDPETGRPWEKGFRKPPKDPTVIDTVDTGLLEKYDQAVKLWPARQLDLWVKRLTGTQVQCIITSRPTSGTKLFEELKAFHGVGEEAEYEVKIVDTATKQFRGVGRITLPDTREQRLEPAAVVFDADHEAGVIKAAVQPRYDGMRVDMREHKAIRLQVYAGLNALLVQARQIWGARETSHLHTLDEIVVRLMVGVGDIARIVREGGLNYTPGGDVRPALVHREDAKKELGNIVFSVLRWIDDLGLDPLECLDLAIEAQEKFAQSGRPR